MTDVPTPAKPPIVGFKDFADMTKADSEILMAAAATAVTETPLAIMAMLRNLRTMPRCALPVDQLEHAVQAATRAYRDNAEDELIVMCLCHDLGKAISVLNHPAIAAEILRPFVSPNVYQVVRTHADFQGRFSSPHRGLDPAAHLAHRGEPWFELAMRFSDDWDCPAFDPSYDSLPLDHFTPLIEATFRAARWKSANIHQVVR